MYPSRSTRSNDVSERTTRAEGEHRIPLEGSWRCRWSLVRSSNIMLHSRLAAGRYFVGYSGDVSHSSAAHTITWSVSLIRSTHVLSWYCKHTLDAGWMLRIEELPE